LEEEFMSERRGKTYVMEGGILLLEEAESLCDGRRNISSI
jgi:hypothetical protein